MKTLALALALALFGCAAEKPIVHTQANPDPFLNQRSFSVTPIAFADLRIGAISEAEYLAGKSDTQRADFTGDKAALNSEFANALTARVGKEGIRIGDGAAFILRPTIFWIEPGYYAGIAQGNGETKMTLQIVSLDGKVLDEIVLHGAMPGFTTRQRMARNGELLGRYAADYLESRVGH